MSLELREGTAADAETCGRIIYEAFTQIAEQHNFPSDVSSPESGIGFATMLLSHPEFYGVVAEENGRVVGSNFLDERSSVVGLGPITVSPDVQNSGAGRRLMERCLRRAAERGHPGVRLLQVAYHSRSLALYSKLGFDVRELCSTTQDPRVEATVAGCTVRPGGEGDMESCSRLCRRVHGHDRAGEVRDALAQGALSIVERDGRTTGYSTGGAYFGHSVGEGNDDLKSLIGGINYLLRAAMLSDETVTHVPGPYPPGY